MLQFTHYFLIGEEAGGIVLLTELLFVFLHSLVGNQISDVGVRALSEALMWNQSLAELK